MEGKTVKLLTGNQAVAEALRQAKPPFFLSTYGQRPGSVAENLQPYANNRLFAGESFFFSSAGELLSFALGVSLAGQCPALAVTAQALASSLPLLRLAALWRLPLVMNVVDGPLLPLTRSFGDQEVALSVRESGWLQIYPSHAQEIYEANLLAFKLAEDDDVRLPVMIVRDEYRGSEIYEEVSLLEDKYTERFFGGTFSRERGTGGFKKPLLERNLGRYREQARTLGTFTGSPLSPISYYGSPQAKKVLVAMGSQSQEARFWLEKATPEKSFGVLVIRLFRPFPHREIKEVLSRCSEVGVWEGGGGSEGDTPLFNDLLKATLGLEPRPSLRAVGSDNLSSFGEERWPP